MNRDQQKALSNFDSDYFKKFYTDYCQQNPLSKLAFYRRQLEMALDSKQAPRVLDAGCGPGLFISSMPPEWNRFGIDPASSVVASASRINPTVRYCAGALEQLSFKCQFDAITAFDVLEHIPDLEAVATRVNASLSPRGTFCFAVPVYDGPFGAVVNMLDTDYTHVHRKSRAFWLDWTRQHFKLMSWTGTFRYLLAGRWYIHRATKALRRISPAICVVARRGLPMESAIKEQAHPAPARHA